MILIIRIRIIGRSKFWRHPIYWQIPVGPITLEFSIKVLREGTREVVGPIQRQEA